MLAQSCSNDFIISKDDVEHFRVAQNGTVFIPKGIVVGGVLIVDENGQWVGPDIGGKIKIFVTKKNF